jgi:cytochrome c556
MRNKIAALSAGLALACCLTSAAYADPQPAMHKAIMNLEQAKANLDNASADKGGHRVRAIKLINQAISEVKAGISFDNTHSGKKENRKGKR